MPSVGNLPSDSDEKNKQMTLPLIVIFALYTRHHYTLIQRADVFHSAGILILKLSANYLLMATLHSASESKNIVILVKVHFQLTLKQNALCGQIALRFRWKK